MRLTPAAVQELVVSATSAVQAAQLEALRLPADVDPYAVRAIDRGLSDAAHGLAAAFYALAALHQSMADEA